MNTQNHLMGLPLGQECEPAPNLVGDVAAALLDHAITDLAQQCSDGMAELIRLVGFQHFVQYAVTTAGASREPPADVLHRALACIQDELQNASRELALSEHRLAGHHQAVQ